MASYERLSAQDASFLYVESERAPMQVGLLCTVERLQQEPGDLARFFEQRTARMPLLRKRLVGIPADLARPLLADDPQWDIGRHVHRVQNPKPYDDRRALRFVEELMSSPMGREHPLWGVWLFDMTEDRTGLVLVVHHCLTDGVGGLRIAGAFLDPAPEVEPPAPDPVAPAEPPGLFDLAQAAVADVLDANLELVRAGLRCAREAVPPNARLIRALGVTPLRLAEALRLGLSSAPATSLSVRVGRARRFGTTRLDLRQVKRIKDHHGCKVNDVVLASVTAGLRALLEERGDAVDNLAVKATVPVDVRPDAPAAAAGNAVSSMVVDLPVTEQDPTVRLESVAGHTAELKASGQIMGVAGMLRLAQFAPPPVVRAVSRSVADRSPSNVLVSNVAGPPPPLYLLGARVLSLHPFAPLLGTTSISVALLSYGDELLVGVGTDPTVVESVEPVLSGMDDEVRTLLEGIS